MKTQRLLLWVPLVAFLAILGLVTAGLVKPHDATVESTMIGKPLPAFHLTSARVGERALTAGAFADERPKLLNVFASWCVPCIAEAPQLMALKQAGVTIEGIAVRDRPSDVAGFLERNGDPYDHIGLDDQAALQVALGSSGVPETFLIDGRGVIRAQHIGEIRPEEVPSLIDALKATR